MKLTPVDAVPYTLESALLRVAALSVGEPANVHCAKSVKLAVWPWLYGKVMAVPPLAAINQPSKVKPACVGLPGLATVPPVVVLLLEIALPP